MKEIKLNNETYVLKSDAQKEIALAKSKKGGSVKGENEVPFEIGKKYFIRTVTYFATGEVVAIKGNFLVLTDGAWIADTGRFSDALKTGNFSEVEPVSVPMFVNMGSISDAFEVEFSLPRIKK